MTFVIQVALDEFIDPKFGKAKRPYAAIIEGPGQKYALERQFLKSRITPEGIVTLPKRNGIYEIRDYPERIPRTRYFQVIDAAIRQMETIGDDDVLDAVEAAARGEWAVASDVASVAGPGSATALEVFEALEQAEVNLVKLSEEGTFDEEDIAMELDKVKRIVERL